MSAFAVVAVSAALCCRLVILLPYADMPMPCALFADAAMPAASVSRYDSCQRRAYAAGVTRRRHALRDMVRTF